MVTSDSFLEAPEGTREEIMRATYLALCEHGYASLTIQRISDEFPKSKSLIYHHYDGKDDLLIDFLEFVLERFEKTVSFEDAVEHGSTSPRSPSAHEDADEQNSSSSASQTQQDAVGTSSDEPAVAIAPADATGADEHLRAVLDHVLVTPLPDERRKFTRAMVELRAQAAHDERYRDHFTRSDRFFRDRIAAILASGIDDGIFADVDPEAVATFLITVINGSMTQRVTSNDDTAGTVRDQVETYVQSILLEQP